MLASKSWVWGCQDQVSPRRSHVSALVTLAHRTLSICSFVFNHNTLLNNSFLLTDVLTYYLLSLSYFNINHFSVLLHPKPLDLFMARS
jgi:hypothetical protein